MDTTFPWGTRIQPLSEIQLDRIERERIAWDEAELGSCRYAAECKAVRERNDVLSIVAHDLRDSLHLIAASAALVRELPLTAGKRVEHLDIITRTAQRMSRLIQDLLDVSRLEADKLALVRRPVAVPALIAEAEQLFRPMAEEAGIELVFETADALPEIEVDPDRILQVLSNLVGNALKFTAAGGRVRVRALPLPHEGLVRVSVIDSGAGIPARNLDHLFDRFWQAETAHSAGAGLGLVIAKGIVERHGGSITVESEPGRGSAFHFTVPAAADGSAAAPTLPEPGA